MQGARIPGTDPLGKAKHQVTLCFTFTVGVLLTTLGFPHGSDGSESACSTGGPDSIPGLGRSSGEGNGYPFQYSSLENFMDCIVHGVAKSQTRLSDFHFHNRCTTNIMLNGDKLKASLINSRPRQGCLLSLLLFNIV